MAHSVDPQVLRQAAAEMGYTLAKAQLTLADAEEGLTLVLWERWLLTTKLPDYRLNPDRLLQAQDWVQCWRDYVAALSEAS